jgi:hypothetical protein
VVFNTLTLAHRGHRGRPHHQAQVERWSLTSLREKVVKIGAKVTSHARYTVFQMAEVAVPRDLFRRILAMIEDLRPRPIARC